MATKTAFGLLRNQAATTRLGYSLSHNVYPNDFRAVLEAGK